MDNINEATPNNASKFGKLFRNYEQAEYLPSPAYKNILRVPLGSQTCEKEIPDGQNTYFKDLECVTYFYDFSKQDLEALANEDNPARYLGSFSALTEREDEVISKSQGILLYRSRIDHNSIGPKLEELLREGKTVTHIVKGEETYQGDTHYSTRRWHDKASVYELNEDDRKWVINEGSRLWLREKLRIEAERRRIANLTLDELTAISESKIRESEWGSESGDEDES